MNDKLELLKKQLQINKIDAFVIPSIDDFQSEYTPSHAKRLEWLTGFTGSNGIAIVTQEMAAFFTDGRYTLQASHQVDTNSFKIFDLSALTPFNWVKKTMKANSVIGIDPWLHSQAQIESYKNCLIGTDIKIQELENLIDKIWNNKPVKPASKIFIHNIKYTGQPSENKINLVARELQKDNIDACIICAPDSVCWLLNIRGEDINFTPMVLARAIIYSDSTVDLFTDGKIDLGLMVRVRRPEELNQVLASLGKKKVQLDPGVTPISIIDLLHKSTIIPKTDPCQLPKACKNQVEIDGAIRAHILDGIAMCKFLSWVLDVPDGLTELAIEHKLLEFRMESDEFVYPSFSTIAGFKENGAIVHYKASEKTNKVISGDGILLVDSGGQYYGGTTDITRTIAIGKVTDEQKDNFTRVLKGHIALAMAKFPSSTTGAQLDTLARYHLWQAGLDYAHGTGHGVGSFLSVHEGPQRISPLSHKSQFKPGMVVSNEPGYYKAGEYGIRIESLVLVEEVNKFLSFRTLTLVPIDNRLINKDILTKDEISWLNNYHKTIYNILKDKITDQNLVKWLEQATSSYQDKSA